MPAVWPWIKSAKLWAIAAAILAITILWLALNATQAENERLEEQNASLASANKANQNTIARLTQASEAANERLIERERRRQQKERTLQDDIKQLEQALQNTQCTIADDVTERLREPY